LDNPAKFTEDFIAPHQSAGGSLGRKHGPAKVQ
jgi:hypothetical protein